MATCKECIHSECCFMQYGKTNALKWQSELGCKNFKDRSRFVELTSKVFVCPEGFCGFITAEIDGVRIKLSDSYGASIGLSEIGKTVFLTREEAKRFLKEREENA